jgi:hypothetical protein
VHLKLWTLNEGDEYIELVISKGAHFTCYNTLYRADSTEHLVRHPKANYTDQKQNKIRWELQFIRKLVN